MTRAEALQAHREAVMIARAAEQAARAERLRKLEVGPLNLDAEQAGRADASSKGQVREP